MNGKVYLSNAFSLSMLSSFPSTLYVREASLEEVKELISNSTFISAVGHQATADVLSKLLNVQIPFNCIQINLNPNDILIVFQLLTRLEEGKILTEEELASIKFKFLVVSLDTSGD